MLHFEYALTKEEFQEAVYYCNWSSPERKEDRKKYFLGQLFSFVFLSGVFIMITLKRIPFLILAGTFSFIGIILFYYIRSDMKSRYDQITDSMIKNEGGDDTILARRSLNVTETGLYLRTDTSELRYLWPAIIKKVIHSDCYYLYVGPRDPIIVPNRVFVNHEEQHQFEGFLTKHLSLSADFVGLR